MQVIIMKVITVLTIRVFSQSYRGLRAVTDAAHEVSAVRVPGVGHSDLAPIRV
jgi:hypothetical protein